MTHVASFIRPNSVTLFVATLSLVVLTSPAAGQAQTTDITSSGLGTEVSAPTPLPNGTINYDITGGTRPGNGPNLFHSFGEFSVGANNIANFLNETALPTSNILSRVTGGNPSNIFGTLQTTNFGAANLYLINPAGVIFGATATLNVGGSFAASTADYLKMTDGTTFSANAPQPTLSIAPVAAFGFTSPRPVTISVQATTLQVAADQTLSLIGGDITIANSVLRAASGQINLASVASPGEAIPNQPSQAPSLDVSSFTSLGQITASSVPGPGFISNFSVSSSLGAGTIVIRAGEMTQDNSFLSAQNLGTVDANVIGLDIHVTGDLILRNISTNLAQTINARGAGIQITAGRLVLESTDQRQSAFSGFNSSTFGSGRAGDIDIAARVIEARGRTNIGSNTFASGRGGEIRITADQLILDSLFQGTFLSSTVNSAVLETGGIGQPGAGAGQGGAVRLEVGDLQVLNGSQIGTFTRGSGNGGPIDVRANSLLISGIDLSDGAPSSLLSSAIGTAASGTAGDIRVQADSIAVEKGGLIRADLFDGSPGNAGAITIQGVDGPGSPAANLSLDGGAISTQISGGSAARRPATIDITAQTVNLANGSQIKANTNGPAPAGDITLNVDTLTTANSTGNPNFPTTISSTSSSTDSVAGKAGSITIQGLTGPGSAATRVSLDGGTLNGSETCCTFISTEVVGGNADTPPGTITITAHTLDLANFAHIRADTDGAAPAGDITLNVGTLTATSSTIDSRSSDDLSQPDPEAGKAGNITIQGIGSGNSAKSVTLDESAIRTDIFGGNADTPLGTITITAETLTLDNFAQIRATTANEAPAGDITLNVDTLTTANSTGNPTNNKLVLTNSFSTKPTAGKAGSITIQGLTGPGSAATRVSLDGGTLNGSETCCTFISTEVVGGNADTPPGTITITAHTLDLANFAHIRADTDGAAPAGDITLNVGTLTATSSTIDSRSSDDLSQPDPEAGKAGNITIQGIGSGNSAKSVTLDESAIRTDIFGGNADTPLGTITITAETLTLDNFAQIRATTANEAPAGDITLNVDTLTTANSTGNPTNNKLVLTNSFSTKPTAGKAGSITIQGLTGPGSAATRVSLDGGTLNGSETCCTFISTEVVGGNADTPPGTITITAHTLDLANFAHIRADTDGAAPAGDITLNVGTLTAGNSTIASDSTINLDHFSKENGGNAGSITIHGLTGSSSLAANVSIDNSSISTQIDGGNAASTAANIDVTTQAVTLSNGGAITASTTGDAPAGEIELTTQQLRMTPDSAIISDAQTGGIGKAGSITIKGAGSAPTTIAGGKIQAQSSTSTLAGNITLKAPGDLTLLGTTVSVKNIGSGNAGSIDLRAGNDLLVRDSQVSTESAKASGGEITLTAPHIIRLVNSKLSSSVAADSKGGDITIDPQLVVIQNSRILANATAGAGAGGTINIFASGAVLVDPNSQIEAKAGPAGIPGRININAPIQVLSGTLVPLTLAYSQAGLSGDRCAADPTGQFSSFVQAGRDGVPQVPGALSPSPLSFLEPLTSGLSGSPWPNVAAARLGLDSVSVDDTLFRFHSACRS